MVKLKKSLCAVMAVATFAVSGICMAASDSDDLAREQQSVAVLVDAIDGGNVPEYKVFSKILSTDLKSGLNETAYTTLQKTIQDKYGKLESAKFYSYQRFDQGDRIAYLASFSKEKNVNIVISFDRAKRITDFSFAPLQVNNGESAK